MEKSEHNPMVMGTTIAIIFGAWTIALWILANIGIQNGSGIYSGMATMLKSCHVFFDMTVLGLVLGTIESMAYGFGLGYILVWLYHKITSYNIF